MDFCPGIGYNETMVSQNPRGANPQNGANRPMKKKLSKLCNRETILYLVFGVLTTLVNYGVFFALGRICASAVLNNAVAFAAAVIFAYVVNKLWVFDSKSWAPAILRREIPSFLAARLFSFGIEELGIFVCDNLLNLGRFEILCLGSVTLNGVGLAKILLSVIVVILNYFFCKLVTFKKRQ